MEVESAIYGSTPDMPQPPPLTAELTGDSWEVRALTAEAEVLGARAAAKAADARAAAAEAEVSKAKARIAELERQLKASSTTKSASRPSMVFH
mmetsp:Transcript_68828/g.136445  ORF Transcript_68828/g.136445 Transcript_68828/m.136445 type:complete len:93 (+) Transcript_68828:1162-1440(+)